jgi:hypothetical protein
LTGYIAFSRLVCIAGLASDALVMQAVEPVIRGRIVSDVDGAAVQQAAVKADGYGGSKTVVETNDRGEFELAERTLCGRTHLTGERATGFLAVTAPGYAPGFVDPCCRAPWADPIRLRASATITGRVKDAEPGARIAAVIQSDQLCWPPRSGLTVPNPTWDAKLDSDLRFELADLPAQVVISLEYHGASHGVLGEVVLEPGRTREMHFALDEKLTPLPPSFVPDSLHRTLIQPSATDEHAQARTIAWFELLKDWRHQSHAKIGGGRWHVHGHRACNDIEALAGANTLIACDFDGRIGIEPIQVREVDKLMRPHVALSPGGLLRLDAGLLASPARVTLSRGDVDFSTRTLHRGVVRYEVVPAGELKIVLQAEGGESRTRTIAVQPGTVTDVEL